MKAINLALLSIICLVLSTSFANAQTPSARAFLDEVSKQYESFETMSATFKLSIQNKDAALFEQKSGAVKMAGDKYVVDMDDLMRVSDGASIWTFFKEDNEVQINEFDPEEQELSPAQLFTIYEQDYNFEITNEVDLGDASYYIVSLSPVEPEDHPYHTVNLTINQDTHLIYQATIKAKNGTDFTYSIGDFEANIALDDSTFGFNPDGYDDIEVIDLR